MTSRTATLAPALVLLGSLLLVGCATSEPQTPVPATPPATPSPPVRVDLEPAAVFPGLPGSAVTSITTGGPGFVAVGFDGTDRAMVWVSIDGLEWKAVPYSIVFAKASMAGVASSNGRLVAVGRDLTSIDDERAAAWTSRDGVVWRRIVGPDLEGAQMISVVPGGPGFVAVGTLLEGVDASAVWTSVDGESWSLVPQQTDLAGSFMWSVASGGPGLVATGWHRNPEPSLAFWTSVDGRTWTRSPDVSNGDGFQGRSVVDMGGKLVAVGDLVTGGAAAIWSSADGISWRRVGDPTAFEDASLAAIARIPDGIIASGYQGTDAAAWISSDAEAWMRLDEGPGLRDAYFTTMVMGSERLVAGGATQVRNAGTGSFTQAAIAWFSTPFASHAPSASNRAP